MKNKKIISLVCALAMVFSMFSAFTAFAADKGIALSGSLSEDGTVITIDAEATGTTNDKLNSFQLSLNIPAGVTEEDVTATSDLGNPIVGIVGGNLQVGIIDMTGDGIAFTNKKLAKITITLSAPLSADYVVTLQNDSTFDDGTEIGVAAGSLTAASTTINKWVDPNAKPEKETRPGEVVSPTPDVPSPVEPVGKGIALTATLDETNTVATIKATAVGDTNAKLNSFQLSLNIPAGVTEEDVTATSDLGNPIVGIVGGNLQVGIIDMTGDGIAFTNKELATIVIGLPEAVTDYYEFKLQNDSTFDDGTEIGVAAGSLTAASAVAIPVKAEKKPVATPALKSFVGKDGNKSGLDVAKAAEEAGKTLYMTVDVKLADNTAAAYGTDFVAEFNGKELDEAEYKNLIHGYGKDSEGNKINISDVIAGLTFKIYNSDAKNMTISTTLNAEEDETQLVKPVEDQKIDTKPAPTPKDTTKLTVSPATKTVYVGDTVEIKPSVTNPTTDGVLTVIVPEAADDCITNAGIKIVHADKTTDALVTDTVTEILPTDKLTFKAAAKGTFTFEFNYGYTFEGNPVNKAATSKITIKEKKTDDGGSGSGTSSSTGSSGPIANGIITAPNAGTIAGATWKDLDSVEWAKEAIYGLGTRNMISGRDAETFDPNANITRAEYCQILVNSIGMTQVSADSSFADVASDAWYYHAVSVASNLGIVSGYGDGNFGPNDLITRQDMALMTQRAVTAMNKTLATASVGTFADDAEISDYAKDAVYNLANAGIINGMGDGTFGPKNNATRAQAAVIIYTTFVK